MSITRLADEEILRTDRKALDFSPLIDSHLNPVIAKFALGAGIADELRSAVKPVAAETPIRQTASSNGLDGLVKYIPTESITLYVAAIAAMSSFTATFPALTPRMLYWIFVGLTPALFVLIYIGKRRSQNLRYMPQSFAQWPWWKLIASTIAFMFWALAVPPLVATDAGKVVAAFGAVLISTLLGVVGAAIEPPEG